MIFDKNTGNFLEKGPKCLIDKRVKISPLSEELIETLLADGFCFFNLMLYRKNFAEHSNLFQLLFGRFEYFSNYCIPCIINESNRLDRYNYLLTLVTAVHLFHKMHKDC